MQIVSREWKATQKEHLITAESFLEISLDISVPDILYYASASDNGSVWFSSTENVISPLDYEITPYATLETNLWPLNGTRKVLKKPASSDLRYIGEVMSNENAVFEITPILHIKFSEIITQPAPGITITWGATFGEYASDFRVTAYKGNNIVAQTDVSNNRDITSTVILDLQNYDQIDISVFEWKFPHRLPRIEKVFLGIQEVYTRSETLKITQAQFANPLSSSLPKYSLKYELDNTARRYDFGNPSGLSQYLIERQQVTLRYGYRFNGKRELISGGIYYLSEWDLPQNGIKSTFFARDILEFMNRVYKKGLYQPNGVSLYSLAEQVLIEAKLPLNPDGKVNWIIDETLTDIYTTAPLPLLPLKQCIQLIANAGCCAMYFDRSGRLHIEPASIVTTFAGEAEAIDNGSVWFSNTAQIVDPEEKNMVPYVTLETSIWPLNGKMKTISPGELGDTGYVSDVLCDSNARFDEADPPGVALVFFRVHRSLVTNMTIEWGIAYNEYAVDFIITAFKDDEIVANKRVTDNRDVISVVDIDIQNYNRITVEVLQWSLPKRRARIANIPVRPDYEINLFNSYTLPEIEITKPLAGVSAQAYKYFPEDQESEIFRGIYAVIGTQTIELTYSQPAVNVRTVEIVGGQLISAVYYTYTCNLTIVASGEVEIVINGRILKTAESAVTLTTDVEGEVQPIENPLITSTQRANEVAQWAMDYLSNRTLFSANWRADPRLDVMDVIMLRNQYDSQPIRVTDAQFIYTGGAFHGTGKGRALLG